MIYRELSEEEYIDAQNRILYEDNHLLIINKKAGEIVQADMTRDETLSDLYKSFIAMRDSKPGSVFVGIPHRLDRPVSGIVILSKTSKALERWSARSLSSRKGSCPAISCVTSVRTSLMCTAGTPLYGKTPSWHV